MILFKNLKSEIGAVIKRDTILCIFLSFFEYFLSKTISHNDTYIYIYTRLDSRRLFSVSSPRKSDFFCRLVSLSSRGGGVIGSNRNVNPATDPAVPLISGDKEAGRKIGRGGGEAWGGGSMPAMDASNRHHISPRLCAGYLCGQAVMPLYSDRPK